MRKLRLLLEYRGTDYSGWQKQPQHPSIQQTIDEALNQILGSATGLTASGRTDAGVHALGQVATFKTDNPMEPDVLRKALNALLPGDIAILAIDEVPSSFHVIGDARGKLYRYRILNRPYRSALDYDRVWVIWNPLDVDAMQAAADVLRGEHDFSSFQTAGTHVKSPVRHLSQLEVRRSGEHEVWIEAYSNGFLRGMVRNLTGALVDAGHGKVDPEQLQSILEARDRRIAPRAAPARGLYLVRVDYEL